MCVCVCVGVYPGYGVLPPDLAAASMAHLAGLGSLSPGGLAYARAAMVCFAFICTISYQLSVLSSSSSSSSRICIAPITKKNIGATIQKIQ